jgi:phosphatidylethanolamine-binding protein (PEBP) family uncharacterized protein
MSTTRTIYKLGFTTLTVVGLSVGACSSDDNSGGKTNNSVPDAGSTPDASTTNEAGNGNAGGFQITSPAFTAGQPLPDSATCKAQAFGGGSSPELDWTNGPAGTLSYAIVLKDFSAVETAVPDHAYHWAVWDIPASFLKLPANLPAMTPTLSSVGNAQQWEGGPSPTATYFGPCPAWMTLCNPAMAAEEDSYAFIVYAIGSAMPAVPAMPTTGNYVHMLDDYFQSVALGSAELHFTSDAVPASVPAGFCPAPSDAAAPTDATNDVAVSDSAATDAVATDAIAKDAEDNDAADAAHE